MTLTTFDQLQQGSEEWLTARRGMLTASTIGSLVGERTLTAVERLCPACEATANQPCIGARGGPIKTPHPERVSYARDNPKKVVAAIESDQARALTLVLTAERITGWSEEVYMTGDMERGVLDEPIARDYYREHFAPVSEIGFMVGTVGGHSIGFSPDGLVGHDGLIEIKSRRPKKHLQTIVNDEVPPENMAQLMCGLMVSGREWIDYISWCGGLKPYVKRVTADERWFQALTTAADKFERDAEAITQAYYNRVGAYPDTERLSISEVII